MDGGSSFTLNSGKGGGSGAWYAAPSNLWHKTQRWIMDLTKLRPFIIQNFDLTSVRVSLDPLWLTHSCASLTIIDVNG